MHCIRFFATVDVHVCRIGLCIRYGAAADKLSEGTRFPLKEYVAVKPRRHTTSLPGFCTWLLLGMVLLVQNELIVGCFLQATKRTMVIL